MVIGDHRTLFRDRMTEYVVRSGDVVNEKPMTLEDF